MNRRRARIRSAIETMVSSRISETAPKEAIGGIVKGGREPKREEH
jgi:hypothetical protein